MNASNKRKIRLIKSRIIILLVIMIWDRNSGSLIEGFICRNRKRVLRV